MAAITTFKRAKIFQPFDALPGLREALTQKEWEHGYCGQERTDDIHTNRYSLTHGIYRRGDAYHMGDAYRRGS